MKISECALRGCYEIEPNRFRDERGIFVKTFHEDIFRANGLSTEFTESYYSVSKNHVLRGLHFQVPPMANAKLVYCTVGMVEDVSVDIRVGSPTFGCYEKIILSAEKANMLYISAGFAHGFHVLSDAATMVYHVTSVYSAECDQGIRWDSVHIPWQDGPFIISERDWGLPKFRNFESPFTFKE